MDSFSRIISAATIGEQLSDKGTARPTPARPGYDPAARLRALQDRHGIMPLDQKVMDLFGITKKDLDQAGSLNTAGQVQDAAQGILEVAIEESAPISNLLRTSPVEAKKYVGSLVAHMGRATGRNLVFHPGAVADVVIRNVAQAIASGAKGGAGGAGGEDMSELLVEGIKPLTDAEAYLFGIPPEKINADLKPEEFGRAVRTLRGRDLNKEAPGVSFFKPLSKMTKEQQADEKKRRALVAEHSTGELIDLVYRFLGDVRNRKIRAHKKLSNIDQKWLGSGVISEREQKVDVLGRTVSEAAKTAQERLQRELKSIASGYIVPQEKSEDLVPKADIDTGEAQQEIKHILTSFRDLRRYLNNVSVASALEDESEKILRVSRPDFELQKEITKTIKKLSSELGSDKLTRDALFLLLSDSKKMMQTPDAAKKELRSDIESAQKKLDFFTGKNVPGAVEGKKEMIKDLEARGVSVDQLGSLEKKSAKYRKLIQVVPEDISGVKMKTPVEQLQDKKAIIEQINSDLGALERIKSGDLNPREILEGHYGDPKEKPLVDRIRENIGKLEVTSDFMKKKGSQLERVVEDMPGSEVFMELFDKEENRLRDPDIFGGHLESSLGDLEELISDIKFAKAPIDRPHSDVTEEEIEGVKNSIGRSEELLRAVDELAAKPEFAELQKLVDSFYNEHLQVSKEMRGQKLDFPAIREFEKKFKEFLRDINVAMRQPNLRSRIENLWDRGGSWKYQEGDADTEVETLDTSEMNKELEKFSPESTEKVGLGTIPDLIKFIKDSETLKWFDKKLESISYSQPKMLKGPNFKTFWGIITALRERLLNATNKLDPKKIDTQIQKTLQDRGALAKILRKYFDRMDIEPDSSSSKKTKKEPGAVLKAAAYLRDAAERLAAADIKRAPGLGHFREKYKPSGGKAKKIPLRAFFERTDQVDELIHAINKEMTDFRDAVVSGDAPPKDFEERFSIDPIISKILMVGEKNLREKLLSNAALHEAAGEGLEKEQEELASAKKRIKDLRLQSNVVRNKYLDALTDMAKFLRNPGPYIENTIESLRQRGKEEEAETLEKTKQELSELPQSVRESLRKRQREIAESRRFLNGRYIAKKELLHLMSKYVKPKQLTDEEMKAQIAKIDKSEKNQIEDIFENTIAETNLTQLSRQHIQEMRDELEALYQKDVSKFDFDPAEYAKMTDDLVERIDRKMRTLRSDSKLLATAKDSLENQDKELEDDDKKEIEDIIKFTQDKMETGNTALTELRKALNELKARHNLLISDKPGMLQERVKAITDEVDKVIKEVKTPAINVNQILAAINASNVTQYISKIGEEIERLRRYVTDDRIPGGIIPGLISKIRPIKWLGSKHDVLLESLNQAQLQVVNNAKHLQEVLKEVIAKAKSLGVKVKDDDTEKTAAYKVQDPGAAQYVPDVGETTATPEGQYEEELQDVRDWNLIESLFGQTRAQLKKLQETMSAEGLGPKTEISLKQKAKELSDRLMRMQKYLDIDVYVGGKKMKARDVPESFNTLLGEYQESLSKIRRQMEDAVNRVEYGQKKIRNFEHRALRGMTDIEKQGIVDMFYQSLFWELMKYWGTKTGEQFQFGEKTKAPFQKVFHTFANMHGVKSNAIFSRVLRNADDIIKYGFGDIRSRNVKASLLKDRKRMINNAIKNGYVEGKGDAAEAAADAWLKENVKSYREILERLEYLDRINKEKDRIYDMMHEVIDLNSKKAIFEKMKEDTKDESLKALIDSKLKEIKTEASKAVKETAAEAEPVDTVLTVHADKFYEDTEAMREKMIETHKPPETVKKAYNREHPDFNAKILYGKTMLKTLAGLIADSLEK
jgi:hypothetical protein